MFSVNNQTQSLTSYTLHTTVKPVYMGRFLPMISATSLLGADPKRLSMHSKGHLTLSFCSNSLQTLLGGQRVRYLIFRSHNRIETKSVLSLISSAERKTSKDL